MKNLTGREQLFCSIYAVCRNGREAAYKAGYTVCPEIYSRKLLAKKSIRDAIEQVSRQMQITNSEVKAGLHRIAFSPSTDAIKLLLTENIENSDIEALDLFNVAEIRRPKGGGLEIKFFDRIKALEKLGELTDSSSESNIGCSSFYTALEKSAASGVLTNEI